MQGGTAGQNHREEEIVRGRDRWGTRRRMAMGAHQCLQLREIGNASRTRHKPAFVVGCVSQQAPNPAHFHPSVA